MEAIQTISESLSISELLNGLGLVFTLRRLFALFSGQGSNTGGFSSSLSLRTEVLTTTGLFILFLAAKCWLALVNNYVPEPYLVSIYHCFCRGFL
jgi:alpha-1,2-glucosyltransferase